MGKVKTKYFSKIKQHCKIYRNKQNEDLDKITNKLNMKEKVVLAFSGGLDTSYCSVYLTKERNLDVFSAVVNTGGFSDDEQKELEEKALRLGVARHVCIDVTEKYYQKGIKYMIMGNVLKNQTYPLSVSSERIFQAIAIAEYAKKIGAKYIAHGSTGAGNDQIRFDSAFQIIAPELEVITPIRDMKLSREEEIEYLKRNGVDADWKKTEYSINKGIWGTSVGGKETLTSDKTIPSEAYPSQLKANEGIKTELTFDTGELVAVDGKYFESKVDAIREVERLGGAYAIGRDMHIGDTIIGIKGRVAFEAAAPLIIIKAHHALEKHTLTKWQIYWKEQLANWYGMLMHEAQYLDPVMRNIEKFFEDSQKNVNGKVFVKLLPYRFEIIGIESDNDLMNPDFAAYGEMNKSFTGEDVKGFTQILSNQMKIYYAVNKPESID